MAISPKLNYKFNIILTRIPGNLLLKKLIDYKIQIKITEQLDSQKNFEKEFKKLEDLHY